MRHTLDEAEKKKWDEEWEALGREIDKAWKSEKSALETLSELRR
ncbi:MAG TPA: hypothetical protein VLB04_06510 [Methanotrichaceae archaeon]|nr:hypothetical protein [Methanotrichaceae archaeon]